MHTLSKYKQKVLLKIFIFQVLFLLFTSITFFVESKITIFITINLIFLLLITYLLLSSLNSFSKNITIFHNALENLKEFTFMRTNSIESIQNIKNDEFGLLLQELNSYYEKFTVERNNDMKVLGEVNLVLSKAEQGIFKCRVKTL